jgi:hypothetical protein
LGLLWSFEFDIVQFFAELEIFGIITLEFPVKWTYCSSLLNWKSLGLLWSFELDIVQFFAELEIFGIITLEFPVKWT